MSSLNKWGIIMIKQELEKRNLPDLFTGADGTRILDKETWEQQQRIYWKQQLFENVFGNIPPYVKPEISVREKKVNFGGKAKWEEICFTFSHSGKEHTVPTQLLLPCKKEKCPVFIYVNFDPEVPSKYLPAEEILDGGFGIFAVCYNDVTTDNGDFTNGLAGMFSVDRHNGTEAGKIMYWAYMATRMMDYLQNRDEIDHKKIGIAGHSRLGKTALLASAIDERFAFVCSNESGCSGAALSRGCSEAGERVVDIYTKFPFWFCENYGRYAEDPYTLPLDQHCLIALSAPRAVFVGVALEDFWADNDSQFLACAAASPVWELYGKKGLVAPDRLPECGDDFGEGSIGFHLRAGEHFHSRSDWQIYMKSALKHFE